MVPLAMADTGVLLKIRKVGGSDKIRRHLHEMGFVVDALMFVRGFPRGRQ